MFTRDSMHAYRRVKRRYIGIGCSDSLHDEKWAFVLQEQAASQQK